MIEAPPENEGADHPKREKHKKTYPIPHVGVDGQVVWWPGRGSLAPGGWFKLTVRFSRLLHCYAVLGKPGESIQKSDVYQSYLDECAVFSTVPSPTSSPSSSSLVAVHFLRL